MPEPSDYECPECGTQVGESDNKCHGCGAVFEENPEEGAEEPDIAIVTAEKVYDESGEPVEEAEKVEEDSEGNVEDAEENDVKEDTDDKTKEKEQEDEETPDEKEEEPPAEAPRKAGLNKGGIVVTVLGVLGIVGAVLLDPLMNLVYSEHSADINMGTAQMAGVLVAVIVLIAGIVITFAMRRKGK